MKKLLAASLVLGLALSTTPAIAQTSSSSPESEPEEQEFLPPTENSSSADLITEPASASSSTLFGTSDTITSGTLQQLEINATNAILTEGEEYRGPGPANADHVQLVLD